MTNTEPGMVSHSCDPMTQYGCHCEEQQEIRSLREENRVLRENLTASQARVEELSAENKVLLHEVREWFCVDCQTVYPGPPQDGLYCVICPKCGGRTGKYYGDTMWKLRAEKAEAELKKFREFNNYEATAHALEKAEAEAEGLREKFDLWRAYPARIESLLADLAKSEAALAKAREEVDELRVDIKAQEEANAILDRGLSRASEWRREAESRLAAQAGVDPERLAQLIAHRACGGNEHDGMGKLHGNCVVCLVPWPCEYAGTPLASLPAPQESVPGRPPHKRVFEYDGAYSCLDCQARWGALPGNPEMPKQCDKTAPPESVTGEPMELDTYDAGLLNDFGGGNVGWWQDYIRAELAKAHDFYQEQVSGGDKPAPRESCKHPGPCHPEWCGRPRESGKEG